MQELDKIDPKVLGQRLAGARKARGVTQEEAAQHLGCSRPTLIAIEKGDRPAKPAEIVKLAAYYGRKVHDLVRGGAALADLQPHLRAVADKLQPDDPELTQAILDLQELADDYRELERLLNAPLRYNYPDQVKLTPHIDVIALAEDVANRERQRLGLGNQPVLDLRNVLEWDVGLRIFYRPLPSALAGMYAYVEELGCCILVNIKHPPVRQRATMLHEYGHLIEARFKPGIDYLTHPGRKPDNERFAETFAMSFLMPASSVRERFHDIVTSTNDFKVADLVRLSHFYFVSVEAMTLRLEGLKLLPKGTADIFREEKLQVRKASEILELPLYLETSSPYPERYKYLAVHAYEKGEISEGQLARFLRCDRVAAREVVQEALTSLELTPDGQPRSMQLEFHRSLLAQVS